MLFLLAAGGGAVWTWLFVRDQLVPLIQTHLAQILNRPIEVGEIESISLTGVRLGPSAIPPTATDPDQMTIQAIAVGFNPLQALLTRTVTFDITVIQPTAEIVQAESGQWLDTEITLGPPGFFTFEVGQVRLEDGTLTLLPHPASPQAPPTPVVLRDLQADASIRKLTPFPNAQAGENAPQHIRFQAQGRTATDGHLQATGEVTLAGPETPPDYRVTAVVRSLTVTDVSPLVTMPIHLKGGQLDGQITLTSQPDRDRPHLDGSVKLQNVVGTISRWERGANDAVPQPITLTRGQIRVKGSQFSIYNLDGKYGSVPVQVNGQLDLDGGYNLQAQIPAIPIATALKTAQVPTLPVGIDGAAKATVTVTGPLQQPVIAGTIATTQPTRVDRVVFNQIGGTFKLNGPNLLLSDLKATPLVGGTIAGQGTVKLADPQGMVLDLTAQNIPTDTFARLYGSPALPFSLGPMAAQIQIFGPLTRVQTVVAWQAPQGTYPAQGELTIADGVIRLSKAIAQVDGGQLQAQAEIANGRWQAIVEGRQLPLARLQPPSPDLALQGTLDGQIQLAGSLEVAGLATTQAIAHLQLPQGVTIQRPQGAAQVTQAMTAHLAWDGAQVLVQSVNAGQVQASGTIQVDTRSATGPSIQTLNLNLAVDRYDLQTLSAWLPADLPLPVQTTGWASFTGQLSGPPSHLALGGDLQLEQLVVNQWAFAPRMAGPIHFAPDRGLEVNLSGDQDQIQLALTPDYRPHTFLIQRQDAQLAGTAVDPDTLQITLANLPLGIFNFTPAAAIGLDVMTGSASGEATLNLRQFETTGTIAIANPALGYLQADTFQADFRYVNGVAALQNGVLTEGQTQVQVSAHFNPAEQAPFQAHIHVPDARTQDLLRTLQWFEISDIGRGFRPPNYVAATTVRPVPIDASQMSMLEQIRRLTELQVLQEQQAAELAAQPLPPLIELNGHFRGDINITGSLAAGPTITFQFAGADWQWGNYTADEIQVQGNFADGVVSFLPMRLTAGDTLLTFTGQLGATGQTGQFRAENIPVDLLRPVVTMPFDMTGQLNAKAAIAGTWDNPQARGEITLVDGTLNQAPIASALGSFSYANARLDFGAEMEVTGPDPIQIIGSIPYQLPFASTAPSSDEIKLDVAVQDSGLALLNLLSRSQLNLVAGRGNLNLQVRGTLSDPIATGSAAIEGATLTAAALPEPLTQVQGTATFDRDRIRIEHFQGAFSGGQILAQGVIPIAHPLSETDPDWENPVTLDLKRLKLKLQPYEGDLTGQIRVTGSAFTPALEGNLTLADGQIRLVAPTESPLPTPDGGATTATTRLVSPPPQSPIALDNLQITLGRNIQVVRQPLLNFVATGDLSINGTLTNLEPSGTIRLRSGQVNLFTTEFVLARGRENTATFSPEQGLDPYLDIQLSTIVPEVTRTPIPTTTVPEVTDAPASNLGALRTIRVQAAVMGLASELADTSGDSEILTLTSTPPRNEAEIVALLGGSFINSIAQGDGSLVLANLAGSALLTNIQSQIGNALGLTDFRLFPVLTPNRESRSSTLGLGAEVGVELPGNLSLSALRVLTDDQIGLFSLRYRINDEMLFRGSTDLSGNSQALLEYETRF